MVAMPSRHPLFQSLVLAGGLCATGIGAVQQTPPVRSEFVLFDDAVIALKNVRVIDGLGAAPVAGQTIVISEGRITALGRSLPVPAGARAIDLAGKTVLPGLVMLHEHLMYFSGRAVWHSQPVSYPRLYLAAGVTTMRTAGTEHPEVDLNLKRRIDQGTTIGPRLHLTGPYFNGPGGGFLGDTVVRNEEEGRRSAAYWAERGFTSLKIYDSIGMDALRGIITEAHARGITVTGHLGSVSCAEAADLGIDFIEHSFGSCRKDFGVAPNAVFKPNVADPRFGSLVRKLVEKKVVMVATAAFSRRPLSSEELDLLHPQARETYLRLAMQPPPWWPDPAGEKALRKVERAFIAEGGRLAVGADAMDFGLIAGHANLRALEQLVEAGWTPLAALTLATSNGAELLGVGDQVGRVAVGWTADLIVVNGDPAAKITDLAQAEMVMKNGVAYDPAKLRASVKGLVGWH
jgi:enamidase